MFRGRQWMADVPNAIEILAKITTASVGCTSVIDRQTTDGQATACSEREREFTFAKNASLDVTTITLAQIAQQTTKYSSRRSVHP